MEEKRRPWLNTNRVLLLEVGLGLVLFGLAIYLYWIPAAREPFIPRWWSLPVLAGLFFGILWLNRWRRGRRNEEKLQQAVRDVTREARTEQLAADQRRESEADPRTRPVRDTPTTPAPSMDPGGRVDTPESSDIPRGDGERGVPPDRVE